MSKKKQLKDRRKIVREDWTYKERKRLEIRGNCEEGKEKGEKSIGRIQGNKNRGAVVEM